MVRAFLGVIGFTVLLALWLSTGRVAADSPTPTPASRMMPPLTRQPTSVTGGVAVDTTDQATRGAAVYAMYCITCHGDRGQGLTEEWRLTWDEEHQNCGRSNCHGMTYAPDAFYLPNMYAPAIMGQGTLLRFQTAQDLFAFVRARMPYQSPGRRSTDEYWAVTAFILRENRVLPPGMEIGESNAGGIRLHPDSVPDSAASTASVPPVQSTSLVLPAAIGLGAILIALGAFGWRRRQRGR